MRRETVRSATSMPSLRSSPWMRGRPPQGIRRGHFPDEGCDLGVDGRAASRGPTRPLSPVLAEASALSSQDGVGRDDDQRLQPAGPDSGEADPQQTIHRAKLRAGRRSRVDGELLAQGQVLEGELAVAADEEGEEAEHVGYEGDHEPRLWPDGADRSITYQVTESWRRTGIMPEPRLYRIVWWRW